MENKEREAVNKEALLNKALGAEFSDDGRYESLMEVARDYLRDKLFYLGCAKIYGEAGDEVTAENYRLRAEQIDEKVLNPLSEVLGEIKLPTWHMEYENVEEIRKYFGNEYFESEDD